MGFEGRVTCLRRASQEDASMARASSSCSSAPSYRFVPSGGRRSRRRAAAAPWSGSRERARAVGERASESAGEGVRTGARGGW